MQNQEAFDLAKESAAEIDNGWTCNGRPLTVADRADILAIFSDICYKAQGSEPAKVTG